MVQVTIHKHSGTPKATYTARTCVPATEGQEKEICRGRMHMTIDKVRANSDRL